MIIISRRLKSILFVGVATASIFATPSSAQAGCGSSTPNGNGGDDYVLSTAETTICALNANDTLSVLGSITTTGAGDGVSVANGAPVSVIDNQGTIAVDSGSGIVNYGIVSGLSNSGTIEANGASGVGLQTSSTGTLSFLNNNGGTIRSTGSTGRALITAGGTMDNLTNDGGTIEVSGPDGVAITNFTTITNFDNSNGTISGGNGTGAPFGQMAIGNIGTIDSFLNTGGIVSVGDNLGYAIYNDGTWNINNLNGQITAGDDSIAVNNESAGIMTLVNKNNGVISTTTGTAIYNNGNLALTNVNGSVISATAGTALQLDAGLNSPLANNNGLITSASTGNGTVYLHGDVGNLTVEGGTISNTAAANTARAIYIDNSQIGTLTFNETTIKAGSTGQGRAFEINTNGGNNINIALGTNSVVLGDLLTTSSDNVTLTTGADITGNLTFFDGDDTINFNDGLISGDIDFGAGLNILNVNGDFATAGTISAPSAYFWNLNVASGGSFAVYSDQDLGDGLLPGTGGAINVSSGGFVDLINGDLSAGGQLSNAGTVRINPGTVLSVGSFDAATAGTLRYLATNTGSGLTTGYLDTGTSAANLSQQTVRVDYIGGGTLVNGARSLIATGTGTAVTPTTVNVVNNSYRYDFRVVQDTANTNELYLELIQAVSASNAADRGNNSNVSAVLTGGLASGSDPVIGQIQANLANASTREEYNEVLEATQPTVDNGSQTAAVGMTGAMFDLADGQLSVVNTGAQETGVASGNDLQGLHFWVQGFGGTADQDQRSGIDGYDADVYGVAAGVDTRNMRDDTTFGLSFGYANTDVDSKNANSTHTDVDSYQLMAYANHDLKNDNFLTGMVLGGYNRNEQQRRDIGGIDGLNANADFDSWVAGARAGIGHNFRPSADEAVRITPQLFSEYVYFDRDGYTESGAGGANLTTGSASENILNLGASVQAERKFVADNGTVIKPDIHATYKYDVLDDDQADTTSSFAAGGSTFSTQGLDPANSTFGVGAGVKLYGTNGWDFTANYDFTFKQDYDAHTGFIRAAYEF